MASVRSSEVSFVPIGVVHTPFPDRVSTPRQPYAAREARGTIELYPGHDFEHALEDLEGWDRLWVIFCFHLNPAGVWRPKVLPPRSAGKRRGVFSTRSPHRPNPIGLSVVRLDEVRGLTLYVRDVDMIDGTPVLDLKPYVPYADAFPGARTGWLEPLVTMEGAKGPPKPPDHHGRQRRLPGGGSGARLPGHLEPGRRRAGRVAAAGARRRFWWRRWTGCSSWGRSRTRTGGSRPTAPASGWR